MQRGLGLVDLAKKVAADKVAKTDYIVDSSTMEMAVHHYAAEQKRDVVMILPKAEGEYPLQPVAHDQVGAFTEIPSRYYDRMRVDAPDLLAQNVNTWLKQKPAKRMVRTMYGRMRAFMSNRYQRIENDEIAEEVLPILISTPGLSVVSSDVTDKKLYIQATTDRIAGEVKKGDVVQSGVLITNSEVGLGSASIAALAYRLICLNGMVLPDSKFAARHVGRRVEDTEALWADDTREADDKAILLKIRDSVKLALDETMFQKRLAKMQALAEGKVEGDPIKAIEVLSKKVGATDNEKASILRALIEGGDLSAWGVVNAVTAQANTAPSYDRAVEFETIGGQLLELPKSDWKEILQAA